MVKKEGSLKKKKSEKKKTRKKRRQLVLCPRNYAHFCMSDCFGIISFLAISQYRQVLC